MIALLLPLACVGTRGIALGDGEPSLSHPEDVGGFPSDTDEDTGEDTDEDPDPDEEDALFEAFYAFGSLHEVRLQLSEEAIDAMNRDVREASTGRDLVMEWQHGDVEIDGVAFSDVAVRVKGSSTLQSFDGKPSLKIKLNEYVPGQKYAGLERITLNNDVEDASQAKQVLVYHVNALAGRQASRASHAQVWVNDELYGLYTNLETFDDHWLERRYEDATGDLWEANDYADFTRAGLSEWELKSGVGDADALVAVSDALADGGDGFYQRLDALVDMDDFVKFWAWRVMVGDFDGYPMTANDLYLYGDPSDGGRITFIPWGVDEAWYAYGPEYWYYATCELALKCQADVFCAAVFVQALEDVVDEYETLGVLEDADAMFDATADALEADPRRPYGASEAVQARATLRDDMEQFPARIRAAAGF